MTRVLLPLRNIFSSPDVSLLSEELLSSNQRKFTPESKAEYLKSETPF